MEYDPMNFKVGLAAALCSPYRTFVKRDPVVVTNELLSSDGYTLLDANGLYLIPKEAE
jgi:hypothetical protein